MSSVSSHGHAVLPGCLVLLLFPAAPVAGQEPASPRSGREVYETACAACHGPDGRGGVNAELEKIVELPDFSDCAFASREPDRAFLAIAHGGGTIRGFSPLMPPWAGMFTDEELRLAISHIRTFCTDQRWPRGELNLPRPLVTAKAFPEDEAVVSSSIDSGSAATRFIYERRFGPLNQVEIIVPFSTVERDDGSRSTGFGDIALEYKRTLAHSLARGNIVSATAELVLPTGSRAKGLGRGTAVFEPFVTFGQRLPHEGSVQAQAGFAIPFESGHDDELFWRLALGKSFEQPNFGRMWTPMLEILGARPLVSGASIEWDLLPGMQVTLNRRQHVRLAGGVRLPVTDADQRKRSVIVYLLWDWYEGGFLQGW
ncbi:MAG TPA: c-type cytochrome [Vicinamibacterales bacterium]